MNIIDFCKLNMYKNTFNISATRRTWRPMECVTVTIKNKKIASVSYTGKETRMQQKYLENWMWNQHSGRESNVEE
jgi:hypothetical protein